MVMERGGRAAAVQEALQIGVTDGAAVLYMIWVPDAAERERRKALFTSRFCFAYFLTTQCLFHPAMYLCSLAARDVQNARICSKLILR